MGYQSETTLTAFTDGAEGLRSLPGKATGTPIMPMLDQAGSEATLPPPRPLRTAQASFPARGSSLYKVVPVMGRPDRVVGVEKPVTVRVQKNEVVQRGWSTLDFRNPMVRGPAGVSRNLLMADNALSALPPPENA